MEFVSRYSWKVKICLLSGRKDHLPLKSLQELDKNILFAIVHIYIKKEMKYQYVNELQFASMFEDDIIICIYVWGYYNL